jgi:hypothetical protein
MRYLLLALLLTGCSLEVSSQPSYKTSTLDVNTLPECPLSIVKSYHKYITFTADNGDVLYSATHGRYMCLKRKK